MSSKNKSHPPTKNFAARKEPQPPTIAEPLRLLSCHSEHTHLHPCAYTSGACVAPCDSCGWTLALPSPCLDSAFATASRPGSARTQMSTVASCGRCGAVNAVGDALRRRFELPPTAAVSATRAAEVQAALCGRSVYLSAKRDELEMLRRALAPTTGGTMGPSASAAVAAASGGRSARHDGRQPCHRAAATHARDTTTTTTTTTSREGDVELRDHAWGVTTQNQNRAGVGVARASRDGENNNNQQTPPGQIIDSGPPTLGSVQCAQAMPMETDPAVGSSSPAIARRSEVLPQPDGPRSATIDPASMLRSAALTATTESPLSVAYATEIPLSETAAPTKVSGALNIVAKAN